MKVIFSNNGLFGGYHLRAVKKGQVVKIQECYEASATRYKTIATLWSDTFERLVAVRDMSNPSALYKIAQSWNNH
jgi:hypothetical protein